jgi:hypothetical protein
VQSSSGLTNKHLCTLVTKERSAVNKLHKCLFVRPDDDCTVETCCLNVLTSTYIVLDGLTTYNYSDFCLFCNCQSELKEFVSQKKKNLVFCNDICSVTETCLLMLQMLA